MRFRKFRLIFGLIWDVRGWIGPRGAGFSPGVTERCSPGVGGHASCTITANVASESSRYASPSKLKIKFTESKLRS